MFSGLGSKMTVIMTETIEEYHTLEQLGISENIDLMTLGENKTGSKQEFESRVNRRVPLIGLQKEYRDKGRSMPKDLIIGKHTADLLDILNRMSDHKKK